MSEPERRTNQPTTTEPDGDTDLAFGYKGGAGLAIYVFKNLMIFGEYRFTHVNEQSFDVRTGRQRSSWWRLHSRSG